MSMVREQVSLSPYTTLKVGGSAQYLIEVTTVEELEQARQFALQTSAPVLVLGGGSNVLVSDDGFAGLVIINRITGCNYAEVASGGFSATYGAGENFDDMVADSVARGYWGLENLSHIPGSVGATPIQNVGAYGVEVSSLVVRVKAFSLATAEVKEFSRAECCFGYRDSYFKTEAGRDWVVISVTFQLWTDPSKAVVAYGDLSHFASSRQTFSPADVRKEIISIRSAKFPDWENVGTAGSFFKNPIIPSVQAVALLEQYPELPAYEQPDGTYKVSLGWLLDKVCHLRGYEKGKVGLSEHQALVLINHGDSSAAILEFVEHISDLVYQKTQIKIEPEVRIL